MAATLGYYNPFRYRGYVWDEETWMYYLRSRYYYPELQRFIGADHFLGARGDCFLTIRILMEIIHQLFQAILMVMKVKFHTSSYLATSLETIF